MRAITVSVDYFDLLEISLWYNLHHFEEIMVVTTERDQETIRVANDCGAKVFITNAFYRDGAVFNKFRALEEGLDAFGRHGVLCIMDADVLWPMNIPDWTPITGCLYTPVRRDDTDFRGEIPPEDQWSGVRVHSNLVEWAGWTQIFHADDPVLGPAPWHETDWSTAGGPDSFFQRKWPRAKKLRPPFEVLHLGTAGVNWAGRSSPYTDGTSHPEASARIRALRAMVGARGIGPNRFEHEKLPRN